MFSIIMAPVNEAASLRLMRTGHLRVDARRNHPYRIWHISCRHNPLYGRRYRGRSFFHHSADPIISSQDQVILMLKPKPPTLLSCLFYGIKFGMDVKCASRGLNSHFTSSFILNLIQRPLPSTLEGGVLGSFTRQGIFTFNTKIIRIRLVTFQISFFYSTFWAYILTSHPLTPPVPFRLF